jgi:histidine ammonia-lyase
MMSPFQRSRAYATLAVAAVSVIGCRSAGAVAPAYQPINPTMADTVITLTGHDLTIDQVVEVARYGAKVQLSAEARQRGADTHGLMMEAAAEGMPVYLFNRGAGNQREVVQFEGDPLSPENKDKLEQKALIQFRNGAKSGTGPEIADEDAIRAAMVVRANTMSYLAASPGLQQALIDLINNRITPVARMMGGSGEADGPMSGNENAAMVGAGEVYYKGVRMPASQALEQAGLKPLQPAPGDGTVSTVNADVTGQAALLIEDARQALEWADLIYAMDLNGMNSSVTPLFGPVQANRPFKWLNWQAARVLGMIKGSYLFNDDPKRIIQDPESLRASAIRQGSAWQAWGHLRDTVVTQMNWSDHNPAVKIDASPKDSWELSTPQAMKYYVKGGKNSNGKHGFIFSNANWDPYPLGNEIEAFTIALANMDVAVMLRMDRFSNPFFTVIQPSDVLKGRAGDFQAGALQGGDYAPQGNAKTAADLFQEIQTFASPLSPSGFALVATVEDLQAQTRIKVARARDAVDNTMLLLGQELLTATYWLDIRKAQDETRSFGDAPTAAWASFRKVIPWRLDPAKPLDQPPGLIAYGFLKTSPASSFYPSDPTMIEGGDRSAKLRK